MPIDQEKEIPVIRSRSRWKAWYSYFLLVAFISLVVLLFVLYEPTWSQPPKKPNIILILSDDQGYNDVGAYGSSDALTPNIDALAQSGIRFEQFYAGGPVCTPTRYGLLTGRHVNRSPDPVLAGAMGANARKSGLRSSEVTIADALLNEGYQTAMIGKWHLGIGNMPADPPGTGDPDSEFHPNNHGIEYFYGNLSGAIDYNTHWNRDNWLDWFENKAYIAGGESGKYATHLFTAKAVDFIDSNANNSSPFFLYLPYTAPHFGNTVGGDPVARTQLPVGEEQRRDYLRRFDHIYADDNDVRKRYLAMVAVLDDGVGEIVDAVQRNGILGDTIIIFISDNGGLPTYGGSNIPLRGAKGTMYEGGIRVPAMIVWQGVIQPDQTSQQLAMVTDIFPTLFSIVAPGNNSYPTDGIDLSPHLFAGNIMDRDISFSNAYFGDVYRRGDWKFVRPIGGEDELYNLNSDLGEQNNLAESNPDVLFDLKKLHCQWLQSMQNNVPTTEGRLFVDKVTQPASDPQNFAFKLFGGPDCLLQDITINDSTDPWDSGYLKTGTYQVKEQTATGWIQVDATCDDGSNPQNISVDADEMVTCTFTNRMLISPTADFSALPTSGIAPLGVNFTNLSTGDFDDCLWEFGDSSSSNVCVDPSHTYANPGIYSVSLTVTGPVGEDTLTESDYFTVYTPTAFEELKADFIALPKTGPPPLMVEFTNLSTGDFDECLWEFGDSSSSNVCVDPSHTYANPGVYSVSLSVKGPKGEDSKTIQRYVNVAYNYRVFLPGMLTGSSARK